jgi:choline-glycine betaine transporter
VGDKIAVVVIITIMATISVLSGIDTGIKGLSVITFAIGNILLMSLMFFDNTWYFLNVLVQTIGHYIQFLIQIGFETDAFQQLGYELDASKTNLLMGSDGDASLLNRLSEKGVEMINTPVAFYEQSPVEFMDWWTIFYWGWWISWAPFVGLFIARISRGRTIRNVIIGAFLVPCAFVMVWFSVLGGLGIKMQRIAELALVKDPTAYDTSSPDCEMLGYEAGLPVSDEAKALASAGYFPLACRSYSGHM